jgi:hypothetical protein
MLSIVAMYGRPEARAADLAQERFGLGEVWISLAALQERFSGPDGAA